MRHLPAIFSVPERTALAAHGARYTIERGPHGDVVELPLEDGPSWLQERLEALSPGTPRAELVRLGPGERRPVELAYRADLLTTMVVTLEPAREGGSLRRLGETSPREAAPGEAWLWHHMRIDGAPDPAALWEVTQVMDGALEALVVTWWGEEGERVETRGRPALYAIVWETPQETRAQLARACALHDVAYVELDEEEWRGTLPPGSLLYRASTSQEACVLEQRLCGAHIATAYAHPLGPHIIYDTQSLWLGRLGIPIPKTIHALPPTLEAARHAAERLGGYPLVLKVPGRSHGVGVLKLDTPEALAGVLDLVWASGGGGSLMEYIRPAVHWRVIVVGVEVAASYVNPERPEDFRTHVEERRELFEATLPEEARRVALESCAALGLEMGGVDVLVREDGEVFVLEVNAPCYFGHPWEVVGVDVAGALLKHLLGKSDEILERADS